MIFNYSIQSYSYLLSHSPGCFEQMKFLQRGKNIWWIELCWGACQLHSTEHLLSAPDVITGHMTIGDNIFTHLRCKKSFSIWAEAACQPDPHLSPNFALKTAECLLDIVLSASLRRVRSLLSFVSWCDWARWELMDKVIHIEYLTSIILTKCNLNSHPKCHHHLFQGTI